MAAVAAQRPIAAPAQPARRAATAHQSGRAGGGGSELSASLTTSGNSKDLITTVSRGNSSGQADGHANGTSTTSGQAEQSLLSAGIHSESSDGGSTTRTTEHTDPGGHSRTAVSRSDAGTGNLNSNGTIRTGTGSETGRDGTFSGHTNNDATVTVCARDERPGRREHVPVRDGPRHAHGR